MSEANPAVATDEPMRAPLTLLQMDAWLALRPDDRVLRRDLARNPPPHVTEDWIAACFTAEAERSDAMRATLAYSDAAIVEIVAADVIVLGTPMYNYGMPSALKAWFDQVIRVGRTFSFDLARGDWPLAPLLSGKRMAVLSARREFGFQPGGIRAGWNHLDPHIATCAAYLGVARDAIHLVDVEYQEFRDGRFSRSLADAQERVDALAQDLASASSMSVASHGTASVACREIAKRIDVLEVRKLDVAASHQCQHETSV